MEHIWDTPLEMGGAGEADDEEVLSTSDIDLGDEYRILMTGSKKDGRLFARQFSRGKDTQLAFNCGVHSWTVVFTPTDEFGADELEAVINDASHEDDVYITDFQDELESHGIPYELRERSQRFDKKDSKSFL